MLLQQLFLTVLARTSNIISNSPQVDVLATH